MLRNNLRIVTITFFVGVEKTSRFYTRDTCLLLWRGHHVSIEAWKGQTATYQEPAFYDLVALKKKNLFVTIRMRTNLLRQEPSPGATGWKMLFSSGCHY